MPIGTCKLCLETKELCDSHFLPKGIYRRYRKQQHGDPIVMTPKLILSTSKQVRDYVLCLDCEALFSARERYMLPLMAGDKGFPMLEKFYDKPFQRAGPFLRFSGSQVGIDTEKLAYFAVSMIWRGAVHSWATIDGQRTGDLDVPNVEAMRRYLLEQTPLPPDTYVFILVCADRLSQLQVQGPFLVGGPENDNRFEMLMSGILLQVGVGRPAGERDLICAVHTPDHALFYGDHSENSLQFARSFHERARIAKNVPKAPWG
jgi:hypothetical protein